MRNALLGLSAALMVGAAAVPALAEYPERPILFVNPNSAGGGTDVGVRTWAPYVEKCLGEGATFVVVARPGATGSIGISETAKATNDGYTIGSLNMPQLVTNTITKDMTYDIDSFDYIGNIVGVRSTINVRQDSEFKTLQDFVDHSKSAGGQINVGLGGLGADDHLAALQFEQLAGVDFNFIPFGDGASSRNALLGSQVDVAFMSNTEAAQFKEEIRPLAVASAERTPLFPDAATFAEQGFDLVAGSDHIIGAPKGIPEEALTKLRNCVAEAAKDPAFLADAEKRAISLNIMDAAQSEAFVREQDKLLRELWEKGPWVAQ